MNVLINPSLRPAATPTIRCKGTERSLADHQRIPSAVATLAKELHVRIRDVHIILPTWEAPGHVEGVLTKAPQNTDEWVITDRHTKRILMMTEGYLAPKSRTNPHIIPEVYTG